MTKKETKNGKNSSIMQKINLFGIIVVGILECLQGQELITTILTAVFFYFILDKLLSRSILGLIVIEIIVAILLFKNIEDGIYIYYNLEAIICFVVVSLNICSLLKNPEKKISLFGKGKNVHDLNSGNKSEADDPIAIYAGAKRKQAATGYTNNSRYQYNSSDKDNFRGYSNSSSKRDSSSNNSSTYRSGNRRYYDSDGGYSGTSFTDKSGYTYHYDSDGGHAGYSYKDSDGTTMYYDEDGCAKGYSFDSLD